MNDERLGVLARQQHGVFSRAQALSAGVNRWAMRRRLLSGDWVEVERGVYRFRGGQESWHQRVTAATIAIGALASHRTAAFLWDLDRIGLGPPAMIEVTAPRADGALLLTCRVHRTRIAVEAPVKRSRIWTTPLARTLLDLSEFASEEELYVAVDSALRKFRHLLPALEKELARNSFGRQRARLLSQMMWLRRTGPTDSALEARAAFAIEEFGLPRPTRQHEVRTDAGRFIARVDFAWLDRRVILQCDSKKFHLTPAGFEKDLRQRRQLESSGWRVIHVTWQMLESPEWLHDLARLLAAERRALPATWQ